MIKSDLVTLRPMVESDKNFVMATALRGLFYGESWFSEIKKDTFMSHYHKTLEYILAKDTTQVVIACLKEDPDIILGYSILTPLSDTAHFVFVKKSWRGIGIGRSLIPETTKRVTHLTKVGLVLIRKFNLDFNPFAI